MADLLDVNGSTKRSLLPVVALETNAVLVVGDAICCDRRVVAYLFGY